MRNLWVIVGFEFTRTIRRKAFWISTLAIPVLIGAVGTISYFSDKTASSSSQQASQQIGRLAVFDESKLIPPVTLRSVNALIETNKAAGIQAVKNGTVQVFFYYPPDPSSNSIEIYARDIGLVKNGGYSDAATQLLQSSVVSSIHSPEKIAVVNGDITTQLTTYKNGHIVDDSSDRVIAPMAYLVLFFLIIVLLGNQMLSSVTEEKENRVIELMLTAVSSSSLIVGKIIALIGVGLVQVLAIVVPVVAAFLAFHKLLPAIPKLVIDPVQMIVGALVFMGGFLVFTGMLVSVGAAMPTSKEATRFFGAVMFCLFAPLYAATAIVTSPNVLIVKVFSFFPLFAPITLLLRNAVGNLSQTEMIVGIVVVGLGGLLAIAIAIQSFRFGTLQYSRKLTLGEVFGKGLFTLK
jgi:ABC-2 type transport system permease protein